MEPFRVWRFAPLCGNIGGAFRWLCVPFLCRSCSNSSGFGFGATRLAVGFHESAVTACQRSNGAFVFVRVVELQVQTQAVEFLLFGKLPLFSCIPRQKAMGQATWASFY